MVRNPKPWWNYRKIHRISSTDLQRSKFFGIDQSEFLFCHCSINVLALSHKQVSWRIRVSHGSLFQCIIAISCEIIWKQLRSFGGKPYDERQYGTHFLVATHSFMSFVIDPFIAIAWISRLITNHWILPALNSRGIFSIEANALGWWNISLV
jgi:hypothetical protein